MKDISEGKRLKNPKLTMRGWKKLASIMFWLFAMGVTADLLKDLLGNRPLNVSDLAWNNMLKIF